MKHICILGSTGSIGTSTLSIIERYPERFAVVSLAAGRNLDLAFTQCQRWRPLLISMATEQLAGELARTMRNTTYDRAQAQQLMREIANDSDGISFEGERSAEQAAMALDSLYLSYANLGAPNSELKGDIDQMYRLLDNPSAYSAPKFAAQMKKTSAAIR